jgi:hypothetical protein
VAGFLRGRRVGRGERFGAAACGVAFIELILRSAGDIAIAQGSNASKMEIFKVALIMVAALRC